MALLPLSTRNRFSPTASVLALALALGACESAPGAGVGDGGSAGASQAGGGMGTSGGTSSLGGQGTTGSQAGTGGRNTAGMSNMQAGQSPTGNPTPMAGQTSTGGGAGPMAGSSSGGTPSTAGAATGGTSSGGTGGESPGGAGGESMGGAGGAGGAFNGECTRAFLDGLLDDYFTALSAGDPSSLPLAATVKFTENAEEGEVGATEFWMDAGDVKYSQRALDTEACSVAAQAVVPEGTTDLPIAIRIKAVGGEMTEIETIVVRQGDYTASFSVDSNPQAIIDIADEIGWHDEVPEAERASRAELTAWVDKYFRAFPSGVCDVTSACRRLENGGGNFSCGTGASCAGDPGASGGTFVPRVIIVDEVRGIAAGLTIFDYMADGHLDMHMVKMSGGEVHAVHALLRDTDGESGWD